MINKNVLIGCYFQEVVVNIGSQLLEKIGSFSMFILESIKDGYGIQEIIYSSGFSESVVMNTINTLISEGMLLSQSNDTLCISELGEKYLFLEKTIESFNEDISEKYAINCYTGQMESVKSLSYFENKNDFKNLLCKLPSKIDNILLKSPNYENVKEYLKDNRWLCSLSSSELDCIYVQVKPKGNRFIVPYLMNQDIYSCENTDDSDQASLIIKVPVAKVTATKYNKIDEEYKDELDNLMTIAEKDIDLLSNKGKGIVFREKQLRDKNTFSGFIYKDAFNLSSLGFDVNEICREKETESKWAVIELPRNITISKKTMGEDIVTVYEYEYIYMTRTIPFARLEQVSSCNE